MHREAESRECTPAVTKLDDRLTIELLHVRFTQRLLAERLRRLLALLPAQRVLTSGQFVLHVRVSDQHDEGGVTQRNQRRLHRPADAAGSEQQNPRVCENTTCGTRAQSLPDSPLKMSRLLTSFPQTAFDGLWFPVRNPIQGHPDQSDSCPPPLAKATVPAIFSSCSPAVYEERVARFTHDGDELVHDATRHSWKRVLGALTRQRLLLGVRLKQIRLDVQHEVH